MKIHVNRVPEEGLRQRAAYDPAALDMGREDIRLPPSFQVDAVATRTGEELVVQAAIRCPLEYVCARCLEPFPAVVAPQALFSYTVQPTDVVDITEDVRQEVILAYPMVPVCRPDCKGLCPLCGANRNVSSCGHQP
jgi:uncharacterized protein